MISFQKDQIHPARGEFALEAFGSAVGGAGVARDFAGSRPLPPNVPSSRRTTRTWIRIP
jgi:hypothetical protein